MWAGPSTDYSCFRFEGYHQNLKKRAQVMCNFKNTPKTVVRVTQCQQCAMWGSGDIEFHKFHAINGTSCFVGNTLFKKYLLNRGYSLTDDIFCSSSVEVNSTNYRAGIYVCLLVPDSCKDKLPLFGLIKEIIVIEEHEVFSLISICSTPFFDPHLNAYCIENPEKIQKTNSASLKFLNL